MSCGLRARRARPRARRSPRSPRRPRCRATNRLRQLLARPAGSLGASAWPSDRSISRSFTLASPLRRSTPSASRRSARTSSFLLSSSESTRSNSRSLLRTSLRSLEASSASAFNVSIKASWLSTASQPFHLGADAAGSASSSAEARALFIELLEHQRQLRAPVGEQACQPFPNGLNRGVSFAHNVGNARSH